MSDVTSLVAGLVGTLLGAGVTITGGWLSARAEDGRQDRSLQEARATAELAHRHDLEQRVRDTSVTVSANWSAVLQALAPYRRGGPDDRAAMVRALTVFGSSLDQLLVLPISAQLRDETLRIEQAVQDFRRDLTKENQARGLTTPVSTALLSVFAIVREAEVLRPLGAPPSVPSGA